MRAREVAVSDVSPAAKKAERASEKMMTSTTQRSNTPSLIITKPQPFERSSALRKSRKR